MMAQPVGRNGWRVLERVLRWGSLVAGMLVLLPSFVIAHSAPYSYLDLRHNTGRIEATLTLHMIDVAHEVDPRLDVALLDSATVGPLLIGRYRERIISLVQSRLRLEIDGHSAAPTIVAIDSQAEQQSLTLRLFYEPELRGRLRVDCALFPYDPRHQTFLTLYSGDSLIAQEIFDRERVDFEYFTGTRQGAIAVVRRFLPSGVYHIFTGPDHILFLIGLLLLGGSLRRLLLIVTAFTIAHSVTLSLAALEIVTLPASVVEPAIALSIVYVGIDNLLLREGSRDLRPWMAFFFGFVHGFGFASVLREFGLPARALGWSLFSFNLGVEIGQTIIVAIVAGGLAALHRRLPGSERRTVMIGSILVILAGAWWFFERVFLTT